MSLNDGITALTQAIGADVKTLTDAIDGKVDNDDARLSDARTPTEHEHAIADVTGLQDELAGKADTTHDHDDRYYTEAEVDALLAGAGSGTYEPPTNLFLSPAPLGAGLWRPIAATGSHTTRTISSNAANSYNASLLCAPVIVRAGGNHDAVSVYVSTASDHPAGASASIALYDREGSFIALFPPLSVMSAELVVGLLDPPLWLDPGLYYPLMQLETGDGATLTGVNPSFYAVNGTFGLMESIAVDTNNWFKSHLRAHRWGATPHESLVGKMFGSIGSTSQPSGARVGLRTV